MSTYQLTNNPDILLCLESGAYIPRGHRLWPTDWLEQNDPEPIPPPYLPNTPEHYRAIREAAWKWMTAAVNDRGYDSIESCCSYFNSSVTRYRTEARAMVAWRDAVNQKLEQLVQDPPASVNTWEQVKELLPQPTEFDWPEQANLPLGESATIGEL